jgi:perosamine synthetase
LMIVHLYGHPCEMDSLNEIAHEHDLSVIEDCAEAFGARYNGKLVGTFGDVATFSFFGNKTITTGEGGMVATNDEILSKRIRHLKGQGLAPNGEYWHDIIGYNYRMTNICAAIGLAQLERSDDFVSKKRKLADMYRDNLKHLSVEMQNESPKVTHCYWMNSILVQDGRDRDSLRAHLRTQGVETRPLFCPVHTMPMYSVANSDFPVAEDLASRGINLPSWPGLSEAQVRTIATHIADYFKNEQAK